jgi:hypothetical protein
MKKFVVLLVVVAMTCFGAIAFAADVTVGGSYEIRSRDFNNLNLTKDLPAATAGDERDTQNRIRIDVNAKAGDVKGKLQLESDFGGGPGDWGRNFEQYATSAGTTNTTVLGFREAWVNFNLPFAPVSVTAGHQLLTLGNGWFFRSMHFGSDAWVISNQTGPNTIAFVDVKFKENVVSAEDDLDAYAILDVFKLSDTSSVGIDITSLMDRRASLSAAPGPNSIYQTGIVGNPNPFSEINLLNLGLNFNGQIGPVKLKAEIDVQGGKAKSGVDPTTGLPFGDSKFKGNQIVVQGSVPLAPVTINFTVARGSGFEDNSNDVDQFVPALDVDPHYTFLYEYKIATPAANLLTGVGRAKNTGFANTTALSAGVSLAATKSVTVGVDFWFLQATEDIYNVVVDDGVSMTDEIGQELDVKVNWKLYDNLAWNWTLGYFKAGDGMGNEDATGIQGVLAFKF